MALIFRNSFGPNIMNNMLNDDWTNDYKSVNYQPAVNLLEDNESFAIELALPGVKRDDIQLDVEKDELFIKYEAKTENSQPDNYLKREFGYNSFEKVFTLPESVNRDEIKATMKDGILSIVLPKVEQAKIKPARKIKIA